MKKCSILSMLLAAQIATIHADIIKVTYINNTKRAAYFMFGSDTSQHPLKPGENVTVTTDLTQQSRLIQITRIRGEWNQKRKNWQENGRDKKFVLIDLTQVKDGAVQVSIERHNPLLHFSKMLAESKSAGSPTARPTDTERLANDQKRFSVPGMTTMLAKAMDMDSLDVGKESNGLDYKVTY